MKIQEILNKINKNEKLRDDLEMFSDISFLDEPDFDFENDLDDVEIDWSIERKCTFAEDGSGGQFYLLSDGSVGFASSEGQADRIADGAEDFLMLIVYCPYWMDFCGVRSKMYLEDRKGFFAETEKERVASLAEDGIDYFKIQKEVVKALKLTPPASSFDVSEIFYAAVTREPRFYGTCHEDDNPETWETESLFML